MQVRRLITILNKMVKDNPSLAYSPVAVFPDAFKSDYFAVKGISEHDIGEDFMEWDNGLDAENRSERSVLVLGVDHFRMKFK